MKKQLLAAMIAIAGVFTFSACEKAAQTEEAPEQAAVPVSNKKVSAVGPGWSELVIDRRVQLDTARSGTVIREFAWKQAVSVGVPVWGSYNFSEEPNGLVETFSLLDPKCGRCEVRFYQDSYNTGSRQFEGYVKFSSPLNDQTVMQILQKDDAVNYSVAMAIKGFSENGGALKANGQVIASGIYGQYVRINVVHIQNTAAAPGKIAVYVNMVKKYEVADNVTKINNMKYGCYNGDIPNQVVLWRKVRVLTGGSDN